jgi:hypothetical protein
MELDDLSPEYIDILRRINAGQRQFGPKDYKDPALVAAAESSLRLLRRMKDDDIVRDITVKHHTLGGTETLYGVTPLLSEDGQRLADELKERDKA